MPLLPNAWYFLALLKYNWQCLIYLRYTTYFEMYSEIINTMKLINMFMPSHSYHLCMCVWLPGHVRSTFWVNFKRAIATSLTMVIMLYVRSSEHIDCSWLHFYSLPLPSISGKHHFVFCLYELNFFSFFEFYIKVISCSNCFCDWLISLGITSSRFTYVAKNVRIFFFLKSKWYSTTCIFPAFPLCVHLLVGTGVVSISWLL